MYGKDGSVSFSNQENFTSLLHITFYDLPRDQSLVSLPMLSVKGWPGLVGVCNLCFRMDRYEIQTRGGRE
jgi:hypothetical protein